MFTVILLNDLISSKIKCEIDFKVRSKSKNVKFGNLKNENKDFFSDAE